MVQIETAYLNALKLATEHYENFPVVSLFVPKSLRKHIAVVYQFSRIADDMADEGEELPEERIAKLTEYEEKLTNCLNNEFDDGFWAALKNTIDQFNLKPEYLYDLLSAFKQDVIKKRYKDYDELLDYCRRSANPIGRIMLQLFGIKNPECYIYSDYVCTALQLINFYQDISVDYKKGRIYIPVEEMKQFGVNENVFESGRVNDNFRRLMQYQLQRNLKMFMDGSYLIEILPYKLKYQISWTIYGGKKILHKIIGLDYNVLNNRPVLTKIDYLFLMIKGLMG